MYVLDIKKNNSQIKMPQFFVSCQYVIGHK